MNQQTSKETILARLKRRHDITGTEQDLLLGDIIEDAMAHYSAIATSLSGKPELQIPSEHAFIITDVASKRYIRRGSEGTSSESVDQYSVSYNAPTKDFVEYVDIIAGIFDTESLPKKGRLDFY